MRHDPARGPRRRRRRTLRFSTPAIAIRSGTRENRSRLSKTKISTTGALAAGPERREDQRRSHIADVGIGAGDALHHRLGHVAVRVTSIRPRRRAQKAQNVAVVVAAMNGQFASSVQRLVGDQPVEQAGQRDVDQEELHPGEPGFRQPHRLPQKKPRTISPKNGATRLKSLARSAIAGFGCGESARRCREDIRSRNGLPRPG